MSQTELSRNSTETLAAQIRDSLADEITCGALAPGSQIDETEIAQRFGASRTPVREALRELASSGLVTIEPRRGARVVALTLDRIGEMFEVMAEIEAMCVRQATYRMTTMERFTLHDLHQTSLSMVTAENIDGYDAYNQQFHAAIYAGTHSQFLIELVTGLRHRIAPFRRAQFRGIQRLKISYEEHGMILKAMFSKDGDTAAKEMRAHMLVASAVYTRYAHEHPSKI
jgi:DNA-binding GntR family transcriptional regulator